MFDWFDYWLKDRPTNVLSRAPVRLFVMGADTWRDEQEWPLARAAPTSFYFHSGGGANTLDGNGSLSETRPSDEPGRSFVYDPSNPVPTGQRGGYSRIPTDQREFEQRQDVLVYTTAPLASPIEVTGPIEVRIVGVVVRDRHRLHGEAGRCLSRWHRAHADRRHSSRALPPEQDRRPSLSRRGGRKK